MNDSPLRGEAVDVDPGYPAAGNPPPVSANAAL
jgi:hypothetical protein